jgi:hypothetical protein
MLSALLIEEEAEEEENKKRDELSISPKLILRKKSYGEANC